jgi:hypothetical protein
MEKPKFHEDSNGTKWWLLNGYLHHEDGPAIEYKNGSKFWYLNGKNHLEDGPACEFADGSKEWYLNGEFLFWLPSTFVFLEEFANEEGEKRIKVLTQQGIEIWPNLPGLKELADNWEKK